ncbi:MAG: phage tail protein [Synergistales bacterium]|nr:phage tail protein [Synergistales bacterium]
MLKLGPYSFSVNAAAYQEMSRIVTHRWSKQDLIDRRPGYQYVGPGEETMHLPGVIYPQFKGGASQVESMRKIAETGDPLLLIDSLGYIYGRWAIQRVEEKSSIFLPGGIPRRIDFSLDLVYVDDGR